MTARVRNPVDPILLRPWIAELPSPPAPLSPSSFFSEKRGRIEVEVGFGKGRFLVTAAAENPDTQFLGIEIRDVLRDYVATRLFRRNLQNAKVMQGDARVFFGEVLPTASLDAIHFYFPDPWWKKRHHRRRLWNVNLFAQFSRTLVPGGVLHMASDVANVYEEMTRLASEQDHLREAPERVPAPSCTTNFEDKAAQQGRAVGRTAFVRTNG